MTFLSRRGRTVARTNRLTLVKDTRAQFIGGIRVPVLGQLAAISAAVSRVGRVRLRDRALVVACVLAIVLPPAAAWASQSTFVGPGASICCWTGYNDGGTFVARDYANIYHACSSYTASGGSEIEYHNANGVPTDGSQDGPGQANCVNPGHLGSSGGNQRSVWCGAYNGGTTNVTNVTCQTSRP